MIAGGSRHPANESARRRSHANLRAALASRTGRVLRVCVQWNLPQLRALPTTLTSNDNCQIVDFATYLLHLRQTD